MSIAETNMPGNSDVRHSDVADASHGAFDALAPLAIADYAARAAACETGAICLDRLIVADPHAAKATAWLARKLRAESETWRRQAALSPLSAPDLATARSGRPATATRPLTARMVESLRTMDGGTAVKSEEFFSWPRWETMPQSSLAAPNRAMLEGMNARGLLDVEKLGRIWITRINPAGVKALVDYAASRKDTRPSPFKQCGTSYAVTNSRGTRRVHGPRVTARTDNEAIGKVKTWLKGQHIGEEISDIRIDWPRTNA